MSKKIFISYCHEDEGVKNRLVTHFEGLRKQGKLTSWDDRLIKAGQEWNKERGKANFKRISHSSPKKKLKRMRFWFIIEVL